jgi:glycosyltransferase involved in cell wall biosynthesis
MIDAMPKLLKVEPRLVWCLLGDGPERQQLAELAKKNRVEHAIRWAGSLYDENTLAPWFKTSEVLVHPGAIGLTLLHAFGYGLPVVTHDNRNDQMPEIAALRNGANGVLFRQGNVEALVESLLMILRGPEIRARLSEAALRTAREGFNTAVMASRFSEMVQTIWARGGGRANA